MMPQTTFRLLHKARACKKRYKHLAKALGGIKNYGRDTPITLLQILNICGLNDALWALRVCPNAQRFARLLACDYAEHVLCRFERRYPDDRRPRQAIETARRYANGNASKSDLGVARYDALNATQVYKGDYYLDEVAADAAWAAWATTLDLTSGLAWDSLFQTPIDSILDIEKQWQEQRLRELLEKGEE